MAAAKYDIFISYRRDGGAETAKHIRDRLTEKGYRVFYDIESLRSGPFNTALYQNIEAATDVLLVLPPDSLDRCSSETDWVRLEIEHALKHNKNIIPIMLKGFSFPDSLPESIDCIRNLNGMEANVDFFDAFIDRLCRQLLQSKPRVSKLKMAVCIGLLAALLVGAAIPAYRHFSKYPHNRAQENLVSELISYMVTNLMYINSAQDGYQRMVNQTIAYYKRETTKSAETLQLECDNLYEQLIQYEDCIQPLPDQLRSALMSSPFNVGDIGEFPTYMVLSLQDMEDRIAFIRDFFLEENYLDIQETLGQLNSLLTISQYEGDLLFYTVNETLLPVTNPEALIPFKTRYWPELTALNSVHQTFSDNMADITQKTETAHQLRQAAIEQVEKEIAAALADIQ